MKRVLRRLGKVMNKLFEASMKMNSSSTVTINGVTYSGNSVSIINGKIVVDGEMKDQQLSNMIVNVVVNGDANEVSTVSGDISVNGNVNSVSSVSGDVNVRGGVNGSVSTVSGDINKV